MSSNEVSSQTSSLEVRTQTLNLVRKGFLMNFDLPKSLVIKIFWKMLIICRNQKSTLLSTFWIQCFNNRADSLAVDPYSLLLKMFLNFFLKTFLILLFCNEIFSISKGKAEVFASLSFHFYIEPTNNYLPSIAMFS